MRPSIEKQLKEMPDSERRELDYAVGRQLAQSLDQLLSTNEEVLSLVSAFIPGDSPRTIETGIMAYTDVRLVFGSMGPGNSSSTPVWRGWKWPEVQGARDKRPMLGGGVELYLSRGGAEQAFRVGGTKGSSKDWAQGFCRGIVEKVTRGGGGAFS